MEYRRRQGKIPNQPIPRKAIICYQKDLLKYLIETHNIQKIENVAGDFYIYKEKDFELGIAVGFGIGAPIAVTVLEELIAHGIKEFISVGTAGTLQDSCEIGDIIVCDKAIRDEGTSYHYIEASKYAYPSKRLVQQLEEALQVAGQTYRLGASWTIDAPYRETIEEAKSYQKEGVLTVEMEASALFAVAQVRGVDLASIFTISDSLAELKWNPQFHETQKKWPVVFGIVKEALRNS